MCLGAARDGSESKRSLFNFKEIKNVACGILAVWALNATSPVIAANQVQITHFYISIS